jgi:hypothetical protein
MSHLGNKHDCSLALVARFNFKLNLWINTVIVITREYDYADVSSFEQCKDLKWC